MDGQEGALRERKKTATRARILEAATELFRRKGYAATSMSEIAEAAEISRKSLFNYMESKESILVALVEALVGAHATEWTDLETLAYQDARDLMVPRHAERLRVVVENRWLLTLAAQHTRLWGPNNTASIDAVHLANREARTRRIAQLQTAGKMRRDISPIEISQYYEVLRDLTLRRWLLTPDADVEPDELYRSFDRAMDVLLKGLAPSAA